MGSLDYYKYQAQARGITSFEDLRRGAHERAYLFDRVVLPWLPTDRSAPVVEIACGHGSFLYWLKERQYTKVSGVDSSQEQVEFARQVGFPVHEMNANKWLASQQPQGQQSIVAIDFIEHIPKDDFMDFLAGAARVLTSGGRLILRYPNGDSPLVGRNLFNDITHFWTYTTNCLETLGRMHGFRHFDFVDEGQAGIRDMRWIKAPLSKAATLILGALFTAATKERIRYWGPHIWACFGK